MESSKTQKCYLCNGVKNLLPYDDVDSICKGCQEEQNRLCQEFKQARTAKFPEIDFIEEGLYLGNEDAATSEDILKEHNITAICVCGSFLDTPFRNNSQFCYKVY
jgi:hypothetical protein